MELEAALTSALMFEKRIRDLYLEAATATEDTAGKKIFRDLAEDEQRHVAYLESRLEEWKKSGAIAVERLESIIPDKATIRKAAADLKAKIKEDTRGLKQQMLSRALEMEIDTSRFYEQLIGKVSADHQAMFNRFLEIENNHIEAVQFELDHLTRTGYWYGFEEFDMEGL